MVAADAALRNRHAPEFGVPDDERVVEHAAAFQILSSPGNRLIDFHRVLAVIVDDAVVRVPGIHRVVDVSSAPELDEANAALDQTPRQQALPAERLRHVLVETVEALGFVGLGGKIHRLRRAGLHAVRKLVGRDARCRVRSRRGASSCS